MAALVIVSFAAIFLGSIVWATSQHADEHSGGH